MPREVILASQSPQRAALMKTLQISFKTVPADLDELAIQDDDHVRRVEKVARAKAETVAARYPEAIILAADTYGVQGKTALEKPASIEEAREMLRKESGAQQIEVTGACYLDPLNNINESTAKVVKVKFRHLTEAEIERYVTTQPVTTWSAAFCPAYVEGMALMDEVSGSFTALTHGFPIEFFVPLLIKSGVMK